MTPLNEWAERYREQEREPAAGQALAQARRLFAEIDRAMRSAEEPSCGLVEEAIAGAVLELVAERLRAANEDAERRVASARRMADERLDRELRAARAAWAGAQAEYVARVEGLEAERDYWRSSAAAIRAWNQKKVL